MKVFFDTEFIEDGKTIELLSIGLVKEDNSTYYAEVSDSKPLWETADPWVKQNVIANLYANQEEPFLETFKSKKQIAKEIVEFVGEEPEFWAYYADYDWVVLCQLYGRMIDLPKGWPMYCNDLKQLIEHLGNPQTLKQDDSDHVAINDAIWVKGAYEGLPINNPISNLTYITKG